MFFLQFNRLEIAQVKPIWHLVFTRVGLQYERDILATKYLLTLSFAHILSEKLGAI